MQSCTDQSHEVLYRSKNSNPPPAVEFSFIPLFMWIHNTKEWLHVDFSNECGAIHSTLQTQNAIAKTIPSEVKWPLEQVLDDLPASA